MSSKEFFEKHSNNPSKCEHLNKEPLRLVWQNEPASKYSPGPVSDDENLCRQVFSPIHIDMDNKTLKPTALSDAENKGLSVFRLAHTKESEIINAGHSKALNDNLAGKPPRDFVATINMNAGEVRTIKNHEGKPGFGIYDTALEHQISHSDICHVEPGKQSFRSIRSKLLEIVQKNLTLI